MSMDLFGEVAGRIGFEGGGGSTVTITPIYSSGTKLADFTIGETSGAIFVDLSNYLTESEIASAYFTKGEVNTMLLADRQYEDLTFQRRGEMSNYQPKLTAGENITIDENNVISASGGGGGLNLPTDGTPVAIGTFGNMTLYVQSVSVSANTYALCRFWTGQSGDILLSANAVAYANYNPPTKMVVPSSITNQVSFAWYTDEYEALPHISIYSTLDSNLWSGGATIKGIVLFAR